MEALECSHMSNRDAPSLPDIRNAVPVIKIGGYEIEYLI